MQKRRSATRIDFQPVERPGTFPVRLFHRRRMKGDKPYVPAPHVHDALEIGLCHEGRGTFLVGRKILPFAGRQIVVVTGREPHVGQNAPGVECVWSWLFLDPAQLLGAWTQDVALLDQSGLSGERFANVISPAEHLEAVEYVERIVEECARRRPHYQSSVRGLVLALLATLRRIAPAGGGSKDGPVAGEFARLRPALEHMRTHYRQKITAEELASLCHMSASHFRTLFGRTMDRSPYQYLQAYRIALAAATLASTDLTVEAVAADVGFPTLSCFTRRFKAQMGTSPRRWAQRAGG